MNEVVKALRKRVRKVNQTRRVDDIDPQI